MANFLCSDICVQVFFDTGKGTFLEINQCQKAVDKAKRYIVRSTARAFASRPSRSSPACPPQDIKSYFPSHFTQHSRRGRFHSPEARAVLTYNGYMCVADTTQPRFRGAKGFQGISMGTPTAGKGEMISPGGALVNKNDGHAVVELRKDGEMIWLQGSLSAVAKTVVP